MLNSTYYNRRSIRMRGYDYSQSGLYFVTICTQDRWRLLAEVKNDELVLTDVGMMINDCWLKMQDRFPNVYVDYYVIMPDHMHFIVRLISDENKRSRLSELVGAFKSISTNLYIQGVKAGRWPSFRNRLWQRNYYESIIRCASAYNQIVNYILNNPKKWVEGEKMGAQ